MGASANAHIFVGFHAVEETGVEAIQHVEAVRQLVDNISPDLLEVLIAGTPDDPENGCAVGVKSTSQFFTWDTPEEITNLPTKGSISAEEHEALLTIAEHLGIKQPRIATLICVNYW